MSINSNDDFGSNVFFTPRGIEDSTFLPPLPPTVAELLCGFPGVSGPGGMVLGSSPGNLSNFLFPKYNEIGIPFSILKFWSSGSRVESGRRIYSRNFRPDENPKISFKMRMDPWGYRLWGGNVVNPLPDFSYVKGDMRSYSRKLFSEEEVNQESILGTISNELPELVLTMANKGRMGGAIDPYDTEEDIMQSDLSLSIFVGNPGEAVYSLSITELEFCQTLPSQNTGGSIKRKVKFNAETIIPNDKITHILFSEPYDDTDGLSEDSNEGDDVFGVEFTIDNSLINKAENFLEVTFLLVVGGRMTTIGDLIYVGKDKSVLKLQESVNHEEFSGPLSWVPQTTVNPIVEGTHPKDEANSFLANKPHKITSFDMSVALGGLDKK